MNQSVKSFPDALNDLLIEKGWSIRYLTELTKKDAPPGVHHASLSPIMRGTTPVSVRIMEACAKSLRVSPTYFAEYRLEQARSRLDWRIHGVRKALQRCESA